jgi:FtsZ-interacting cell division protein YlmF
LDGAPVSAPETERLEQLDGLIRMIVEMDLPDLDDEQRERVIGHLTGAVFVSTGAPA